jgi:8-oxo-dGTP diphosphatase
MGASMRQRILNLVRQIKPLDDLEQKHIDDMIVWIESGDPIFRVEKPAVPHKHLVAYFVVIDVCAKKMLLVHHKKAQRWLPTGGYVEPGEHPLVAVKRECLEGLGVELPVLFDHPLFVTQTETVGLTAGHIDVSMWYIVQGAADAKYLYDQDEFLALQWFALDDIPFDESDPHMRRFIDKMSKIGIFDAAVI